MQTALILSQTIFYFAFSLAIIVIGVFFSIITFHLVSIAKELKAITQDIHNLTDEASERISDIVERLSKLPFLSFFLKSKQPSRGHHKKGSAKD